MRLIKPYTEIITNINGDEILKTIEKVARTCYKSESKISESTESAETLIKNTLLSRNHEAMLEFYDIIVKFVCDRGVSHEIVRHRLASYAQESTRYCNYSKDKFDNQITYIIPEWLELNEGTYDQLKIENSEADYWFNHMLWSEKTYNYLVTQTNIKTENVDKRLRKWSPQEARSVLPNSLKTEINVKMNLREWRHFFKLRCANAAHPQMRELTIPLLEEFRKLIPIIFDDITY